MTAAADGAPEARHEGAGHDALRLLALVGKEIVEVLRRPGALISLVLGPFLIMAVFGLGYNGVRRPLETVVVMPPASGLSTDVAEYQGLAGGGLHIGAVVPDEAAAEPGLADGSTDVVVVAPPDAQAQFKAGKQSIIGVKVNTVDPIRANYAGFLAGNLANAVNQDDHPQGRDRGRRAGGAGRPARCGQRSRRTVVAAPTRPS